MDFHHKNSVSIRATQGSHRETIKQYRGVDETLAMLIERNHIEIPDFLVLSFMCDAGKMTVDQIATLLGFSQESTLSCIERLRKIELLTFETFKYNDVIKGRISPSSKGRAIANQIHSSASMVSINALFSGRDRRLATPFASQRVRASRPVTARLFGYSAQIVRERT